MHRKALLAPAVVEDILPILDKVWLSGGRIEVLDEEEIEVRLLDDTCVEVSASDAEPSLDLIL